MGLKNNKNFGAIDLPDCLNDILEYIKQSDFEITNTSKEGRDNSKVDETKCKEILKKCENFYFYENLDEINIDSYTNDTGKTVIFNSPELRTRYWCDLVVIDVYDKKHYINIKSSILGSSPDNAGTFEELYYAVFGKRPEGKNPMDLFLKEVIKRLEEDDFDTLGDFNYYYLILNKNNVKKSFFTSVYHFNKDSIHSNADNQIQVHWSKCSKTIRQKKTVAILIADTIMKYKKKLLDRIISPETEEYANIVINEFEKRFGLIETPTKKFLRDGKKMDKKFSKIEQYKKIEEEGGNNPLDI